MFGNECNGQQVNGPVHFPVWLSTVLVGIAGGLPGQLSMEANFQHQERVVV
jgi:hypothetical protein